MVTGLLVALVAPMTMNAAHFLTLLIIGAFIGALGPALRRSMSAGEELDSAAALRDIGAQAAAGAVVAVGMAVLLTTLGPYGWALILATVPAYLLVRVALRSGSGHGPGPAPGEGAGVFGGGKSRPESLERSSTEEIAAGWVASHRLLRTSSSPATRAYVAALRQQYLDELERRDPVGLQRWLASEPDAAADPRSFLDEGRDGGGGDLRQG